MSIMDVMMLQKSVYNARIRGAGYKVTGARSLLVDTFKQADHPLSLSDLGTRLKEKQIDIATVYRNLKVLKDARVIQQVDFRDTGAHYELIDDHNHHHHLVCVLCGKTEDFHNCGVDEMVESVLKKSSNFSFIESHSMEMFGVCKSCSNRSNSKLKIKN